MWIGVVSLFPEMFKAITEFGVTGRAVKHNLLQVECWNPRDFTFDKHKTVDDRPYGGGPGMQKVDTFTNKLETDRWMDIVTAHCFVVY